MSSVVRAGCRCMTTDEKQIRALIERWATAAHAGDMDGVLADHADDIVMFDVPPPYRGARGIDAYRETWPPFFEWQAQGAVFEIESLEVEVGGDLAFAHALLRCGMPEELGENRLRLTLGLRREEGRWIVAHEHHSFAQPSPAVDEVRELHEKWFDATARKDLDSLMAPVADDVVVLRARSAAPIRRRGQCSGRLQARTGGLGRCRRVAGPGPEDRGTGRPRGRVGTEPHDRRAAGRHDERELVTRHAGVPAPGRSTGC